MGAHKLEVVEHETPRWLRIHCTSCGERKTMHKWQLEQGEVAEAFDKVICKPPTK